MICPKCKLDTLNAEADSVVCSNCGFKTTLLEYDAWKTIEGAKPLRRPPRRQEVISPDKVEKDEETSATDQLPADSRLLQVLIIVIIVVIVLLLFM